MNLADIKKNNERTDSMSSVNNPEISFAGKGRERKTAKFDSGLSEEKGKKKKGFLLRHKIFAFFLLMLIVFSSAYTYKYWEIKKTGLNIGLLDPFKGAISAIAPPSQAAISNLEKTDGRTNVLLIGVDARSYNESYLTDSIMLLSYDHETKTTAQISFPRDLEARYTINKGTYDAKINSIFPNTYSQTKSFDQAFENLGEALENISGLKVHYGVLVNFRGFQKIIDSLGGITVDVENSFTDYEFPRNDDKGYITVSFKKGSQQMNGDKALQYARSRHSMDNGEGSDFSRARRQQKVIAAIKEKIISSNLFSKASAFNDIVNSLEDNIRFYNVGGDEIDSAVKSRDLLKDVAMYSMVIDPSLGGQNAILTGKTWSEAEGYQVRPNIGKANYSEVKEKVDFYLDNYFLLADKAKFKLVWTDPQRFSDYVSVKKAFWAQELEFEFNDPIIRETKTTTSTTVKPTQTGTTKNTTAEKFGTIYKLTDKKSKSFDYYTKMLKEEDSDLVFDVKTKADLPSYLEKTSDDQDFLIVID